MTERAPLDSELASALAGSPFAGIDFTTMRFDELPAVRATMDALSSWIVPDVVDSEVVDVATVGGDHAIRCRTYRPRGGAAIRPLIYWIHGGGYVCGSGLPVDRRLVGWADQLDCVVVSVDYRLAPEFPFPVPLDDCVAGLAWALDERNQLGIDRRRVIVAGASAGGGLAAAMTLRAVEVGDPPLAAQVLCYPMIDDRTARTADHVGWRAYLGTSRGQPTVSPYAAAARATDLSGLPPTFVAIGALDSFVDDSIQFAGRLIAAGVPTELHVYPGAPHGFETAAPAAQVAQQMERDVLAALRRATQMR